ncbi:hypothetical protein G4H71_20435 [Rhodococcus triatomae]|nr:hypothetical protein G4H72_09945 [Rhodococcus triatomae]QNG25916.1 hypothetical protein G4H71_20435 [Rhodococcus triatomae]
MHPGQFRLARVQVVNWGTLHGYRDIPVARRGFLITGSSGSGKSTLIDAVSAVLMPGDRVQFNAAAQESGKSGRNLVSYLRGAWRREAGTETDGLVASYLREGATWSAIVLTYRSGDDHPPVTLVKLMHLARGRNAVSDITHLHVILDDELDARDLEAFTGRGIDNRAIRRRWPSASVNPSYAPFARSFRSKLGIESEAAQRLLHRTLSAKSLGSLDQLFRDYMLDAPSTIGMADRAVGQFHDLREAHRVVVDAREQIEALTPLDQLSVARRSTSAALSDTDDELSHLDAVRAQRSLELLLDEQAELAARTALLDESAREAEEAARRAREHTLDLRVRLEGIDGGRLSTLQAQRDAEARVVAQVRLRRDRVIEAVSVWQGSPPASAEDFLSLRSDLEDQLAQSSSGHEERRRDVYEISHRRAEQIRARERAIADREALAHRTSNIDPSLLRVRELVCSATGLTEDQLPFAGELIAVRDEYTDWSGPIERVLGGLARTLLVPETLYRAASSAVDGAHLGTRLVYRRIRTGDDAPTPQSGVQSLVRRLDVAEGPFARWIHRHLAEQYDYACVETAEDFPDHRRAVSRGGQVKHSAERHEKDDRRHIDDRSRWALGFDNEPKLTDLRRRIDELEKDISGLTARLEDLDRRDQSVAHQNRAAQTVLDAQWSDIDLASAEAALAAVESRLTHWQQDNPEHEALRHAVSAANTAEAEAAKAHASAESLLVAHRKHYSDVETRIAEAQGAATAPVPEEVAARIDSRLARVSRRMTATSIDGAMYKVQQQITAENRRAREEL